VCGIYFFVMQYKNLGGNTYSMNEDLEIVLHLCLKVISDTYENTSEYISHYNFSICIEWIAFCSSQK
jgi:hypothetical protein